MIQWMNLFVHQHLFVVVILLGKAILKRSACRCFWARNSIDKNQNSGTVLFLREPSSYTAQCFRS